MEFENMDLEINKAIRVPLVLLIDNSASMKTVIEGEYEKTGKIVKLDGRVLEEVHGGVSLSDKVVEGVNLLYDIIRSADETKYSCEIAIVSFSNEAKLEEDFATVEYKEKFEPLKDESDLTNMAKGITLALKVLEDRKQLYKDTGVPYYQPWLMLFTDGDSTEKITGVQKTLKKLEAEQKLTTYIISLHEDVNLENLKGFSDKSEPIELDTKDFKKFFQWIGMSMRKVVIDKGHDEFDDFEEQDIEIIETPPEEVVDEDEVEDDIDEVFEEEQEEPIEEFQSDKWDI